MEHLDIIRDLGVVWIAALVASFLCVRLKLPNIAGYVLMGVAIGPHGLKLINHSEQISTLAEFGVALLLFALGVSVSLTSIMRAAKTVIGAGIAQMASTVILVMLFLKACYGATPVNEMFVFGIICAISSSVVISKVLLDRHEADSIHGKLLIGISLVQDLSLIPVMTLFPALQGQAVGWEALAIAAAKAALLLGIVFIGSRRIVPALFSQVVKTDSRETFLLTAITLCLCTAFLSHSLGVSMALGAFLGGIMISEYPYGHQALADIGPIRDLFATVFFVSVGMLLDPFFVANHLLEVLGFITVVIVGKAIVSGFSALIATRNPWSAVLTGVGLSQVGEFSFVLATVALEQKILSNDLYNLFLAGAVVSLVISPTLMMVVPKLLRNMVLAKDENMPNPDGAPMDLTDHVILCGFGRTGRQIGTALQRYGIPFVVLELSGEVLEELRRRNIPHLYGDAISRQILLEANIMRAKTLVLSIPDPIGAVVAATQARQLNPNIKIIARAHRTQDFQMFRLAGANAVIQAEFEASIELTRLALISLDVHPAIIERALNSIRRRRERLFESDITQPMPEEEDVAGFWFHLPPEAMNGKTLQELDIRRLTGATVVAIKRGDRVLSHPGGEFSLENDDEMYVAGTPDQIAKFEQEFHCKHMEIEPPLAAAMSESLPEQLN